MKATEAVRALAALAQDSRLSIYRLLVERGPEGYAAGEIARQLHIAAPTLSFHLKELTHAGLLLVRKKSRFVHYSANFAGMTELLGFLTDNCCSRASNCEPGSCAPLPKPARRRSRA